MVLPQGPGEALYPPLRGTLKVRVVGVAVCDIADESEEPCAIVDAGPIPHVPRPLYRRVRNGIWDLVPMRLGEDWNKSGPEADIVFVQEAKNLRPRDILGGGWAVRQDTPAEDRRGSAVVIRESVQGIGVLVKGGGARPPLGHQ